MKKLLAIVSVIAVVCVFASSLPSTSVAYQKGGEPILSVRV